MRRRKPWASLQHLSGMPLPGKLTGEMLLGGDSHSISILIAPSDGGVAAPHSLEQVRRM